MITLEDCIGLCGLTEEEVLAVAEHEHLPQIAAMPLRANRAVGGAKADIVFSHGLTAHFWRCRGRLGFTINDKEAWAGVRQRSGEDLIDGLAFVNLFSACSKTFRNVSHVQVGIVKIHADEACGLNRCTHGMAPEVLEQAIFVIHKADEYGWDCIFGRRP